MLAGVERMTTFTSCIRRWVGVDLGHLRDTERSQEAQSPSMADESMGRLGKVGGECMEYGKKSIKSSGLAPIGVGLVFGS